MSTLLLYFICVTIWGSTYFVITFQLGGIAPEVSVFYRFALATAISFSLCLFKKKRLLFSKSEHFWFMAQGFCMFSASYILTYYAELSITSGIVAVSFTLLIYLNILGMRFFYKKKIDSNVVWSGLVGATGVALIFYNEIINFKGDSHSLIGLGFAICANIASSLGNMASVKSRQNNLPILESNAWSMLYGTLLTLLICFIYQRSFSFNLTPSYAGALLYLVVFGTIIAFAAYMSLVGSIGPEKAAYTGVLIPVIALLLSTLFENFQWKTPTIAGVLLCLGGNYMVLRKKS